MRAILTCLFLTSLSMVSSQLTANIEIFNCPAPDQITINGQNWTSVVNPGSWIGTGTSSERAGNWENVTLIPNASGTTQIECAYANGKISTLTQNVCVFSSTERESCSGPNCSIDCAPLSQTATLSGHCDGKVVDTGTHYPCFPQFENQLIFKPFTVTINPPANCNQEWFIGINMNFTTERHPICYTTTLGGYNPHILQKSGRFSIDGTYEFCPQATITFSLPKNGKCP